MIYHSLKRMAATSYRTNRQLRLAPAESGGFILAVPNGDDGHFYFEATALMLELLDYFTRSGTARAAVESLSQGRGLAPRDVWAAIERLDDAGALAPIEDIPGGESLDAEHRALLLEGARRGVLPANVRCVVGCRFCYSRRMGRMFPGCAIDSIPPYSPAAFDFFFGACRELHGGPIAIQAVWRPFDGRLHYGSHSDVFSLGLSEKQIEQLLAHNESLMLEERWSAFSSRWYTTGYRVDPRLVEALSSRFPTAFRLIVSAITFNDELRAELIPRVPEGEEVKRLLLAAKQPTVMLLHVGERQTMEDLAVVDRMGLSDPKVTVSALYSNSWHDDAIQALAREARRGIGEVARRILSGEPRFSSLSPENVSFLGPDHALAHQHQRTLESLLDPYEIGAESVVLCSVAARATVERIVGGRCQVVAVPDSLGGTTTFATTVTTADVLEQLRRLSAQGNAFSRVFVPSSFWSYAGRDFSGATPDALRRAFPGVAIAILPIPFHVLDTSLSCAECATFSGDEPAVAPLRPAPAPRIRVSPFPLGWRGRAREALAAFVLTPRDVIACPGSRLILLRDIVGPDLPILSFEYTSGEDAGTDAVVELAGRIQRIGPPRRLLLLGERVFDGGQRLPPDALARLREHLPHTKVVVVIVPAF